MLLCYSFCITIHLYIIIQCCYNYYSPACVLLSTHNVITLLYSLINFLCHFTLVIQVACVHLRVLYLIIIIVPRHYNIILITIAVVLCDGVGSRLDKIILRCYICA